MRGAVRNARVGRDARVPPHTVGARAPRYADPVSLVTIDLDHFKQLNDRYGHPAGDVVLREAANSIRGSIRDPDICARSVTASLGIAFYPAKDITSPELLLRFADEALYQAKKAGRNQICLYQAQPYTHDPS